LPFSDNTGFEVVSKEREWFDPHLSLWNAEVVDGAFTGCEESAERMSEWMRVLEFLVRWPRGYIAVLFCCKRKLYR